MTFDMDVLPCWFVLTIAVSASKVKVVGQSSRSREENVSRVVGATSSEGFLIGAYFTS